MLRRVQLGKNEGPPRNVLLIFFLFVSSSQVWKPYYTTNYFCNRFPYRRMGPEYSERSLQNDVKCIINRNSVHFVYVCTHKKTAAGSSARPAAPEPRYKCGTQYYFSNVHETTRRPKVFLFVLDKSTGHIHVYIVVLLIKYASASTALGNEWNSPKPAVARIRYTYI